MKGLVSVIVPVYNVELYLNRCVNSIVQQTYKNLEIILIDDGSTDNSGKICDDLKELDNRIKVIHKENGGLSSARNAGIEIASGEYITFIDSDDFIDLKMIEVLVCKSQKQDCDIVICNRYYYFNEEKNFLRYKKINSDIIMNSEQAIYELNSYRNFDMSAWAKLFKKNLFKEIRFPIGKISEDFYIMYLLFDNAKTIIYTSEPFYFYFQRKGSISKSPKLRYDFVDAAYQQMVYVEKKYPSLSGCVHAAYASANMTIYNIFYQNGGKCNKEELHKLQMKVKDNYEYIVKSKDWSRIKKIQAFLFIKNIVLYNLLLKIYKIVKKV